VKELQSLLLKNGKTRRLYANILNILAVTRYMQRKEKTDKFSEADNLKKLRISLISLSL